MPRMMPAGYKAKRRYRSEGKESMAGPATKGQYSNREMKSDRETAHSLIEKNQEAIIEYMKKKMGKN